MSPTLLALAFVKAANELSLREALDRGFDDASRRGALVGSVMGASSGGLIGAGSGALIQLLRKQLLKDEEAKNRISVGDGALLGGGIGALGGGVHGGLAGYGLGEVMGRQLLGTMAQPLVDMDTKLRSIGAARN